MNERFRERKRAKQRERERELPFVCLLYSLTCCFDGGQSWLCKQKVVVRDQSGGRRRCVLVWPPGRRARCLI